MNKLSPALLLITTVISSYSYAQNQGHGASCIHEGVSEDILSFNIHTTSVIGANSDREFEQALHHHDPAEEVDLQLIEFSLFSNLNTYTQLFSTYTVSEDRGALSGELEETYLRLHNLPHGFEVKAGRFIHNLGLQGNLHTHDWDFTHSDLTTALFLGEEGVSTDGAELNRYYIYDNYGVVGITLAHGKVTEPGEDGGFTDTVTTVRSTVHHYVDDFNQHFVGLSFAEGTNDFGRETKVVGLDYTYSWNATSYEAQHATVDTSFQITNRNIQWQEGSQRGESNQLAMLVSSIYNFSNNWSLGGRAEWIEGVDTPTSYQENERFRLSAAVTRSFSLFHEEDSKIRLQYNYDEINGDLTTDNNHSLWLQFNFSIGTGWSPHKDHH